MHFVCLTLYWQLPPLHTAGSSDSAPSPIPLRPKGSEPSILKTNINHTQKFTACVRPLQSLLRQAVFDSPVSIINIFNRNLRFTQTPPLGFRPPLSYEVGSVRSQDESRSYQHYNQQHQQRQNTFGEIPKICYSMSFIHFTLYTNHSEYPAYP